MANEPKRYAVIDKASGDVVNVILWDGASKWLPPEGCRIEADDGTRGRPVDPDVPTEKTIEDRLAALEAKGK